MDSDFGAPLARFTGPEPPPDKMLGSKGQILYPYGPGGREAALLHPLAPKATDNRDSRDPETIGNQLLELRRQNQLREENPLSKLADRLEPNFFRPQAQGGAHGN